MSEHRQKPIKVGTTRDSAAGRIEHEGGRNVWRWKKTSPNDSTSVLLKQLDNDELQLEPTARVPRPSRQPGACASEAGRDARASRADSARDGHPRAVEPVRDGRRGTGPALDERRAGSGKRPARDAGGGFDPYNTSRR